ncbi:recombination and DNA strand exchange inhibitor protein [Fictibacillus macauensis ZFHKF-1]|uniref:Endonuclease MutS2 n=1 Tax=Fictibacillus macauensis ZFHKF-1 TaxID=1196324 RepID=I8AIV0_9BACL|nr:endonuclease MutS2 [Fictibacillus macauensis]EIT85414.1 recombination and DNA strand exchange inhibitor protein [Fictibacillus macauensis ZFHKF-1]
MQERVLRVLEFTKIVEQVKNYASSSLGKQVAEGLKPSTDFAEVKRWQDDTDEGVKVLRLKGQAPLGGIRDIRASVKRAAIGGMLFAEELVDSATTIHGGRRFKRFVEGMVEDGIELPLLAARVEEIDPLQELEAAIKACIDDNGHVMDSASPELRTIRGQLRTFEARVREKLESMVRSSSYQKMLSDTIITIRNDRFVLPVKQEYRANFGGMVHDQSSSGATLFIEPQAIITINNQLKEAKAKETREIEKILRELSGVVGEHAEPLLHNVAVLAQIDFIFAKAFYSRELKATKPIMNDQQSMSIIKARHPLIDAEAVVPIDATLGGAFQSLIITGPNTGGKTVTLKTIGLLSLMAQSGLQIPAEEQSEMTVFETIYADIGDEQSIEQSLSTFSSHMVNIVDILKTVNYKSLVLFDELGAGTDPQEGAALAISILDYVFARGARVVATTHYSELKAYAYNREGVMNASVEFNVETLRPTYKLLIGVPGRSNAFEISRRLGLDVRIIDEAKAQISAEDNKIDNMIRSLEDNQKRAEFEREEAIALRQDAEKLKQDLQQKLEQLEAERDGLLEQAERKAEEAVAAAKKTAEDVIKELRTFQQEAGNVKEHRLIEARKKLDEATPTLRTKKKKQGAPKPKAVDFEPGDEVKVLSFGQKGHIIAKVSNQEYSVQIGILKMNVSRNDLELLKQPKEKKQEPRAFVKVQGSDDHVSPELDLRGKRYEDAMLEVDKYLDEAMLAGFAQVSIIHGKGTGALRSGVQQLLKTHPNVKSTRMGAANEGGSGMTVAILK